jgi:hypothetical protein
MTLTDLIRMEGYPFRGDSQQRYIRSIKKDFTVREFVLSVVDFNLCGGDTPCHKT